MFYKLSQISIFPRSKPTTTGNVYIGQVDPEKELLAGKLFIILEIESTEPEDLKIMNFLLDDIGLNYYQNEKVFYREYNHKLKIDNLLESTLTNSNKRLLKFCAEHKIKLYAKNINITVGVIHKENVYFSINGKNKALLIARSKEQGAVQYKLYDVLKQTQDTGEVATDKDKNIIFSNIISGHLPKNSYFVFSNEALPEYLSSRELIKVITTLPPSGAVEQLKNSLSQVNSYIAFLGVVIKNTTGRTEIKVNEIKQYKNETSQTSISYLNNTERATEKLLSARGTVNFQKILERINLFISAKTNRISNQSKALFVGERIILKKRGAFLLLKKFLGGLKNIILSIIYLLGFLANRIKGPDKSAEKNLNLEKRPSQHSVWKKIFIWLIRLKLSHKIYLIVIIVCLFLFSQNILFTNTKNKNSDNQKLFSELSVSIQQKQNQIESTMLYNKNEADIKILIDELKVMIDKLPQDTDLQKGTYSKYLASYDSFVENIRHIVKIQNLNEAVSIQNINSNSNPEKIIKINDELYVIDYNSPTLFKYATKNNLTTSLALAGSQDKIILASSESPMIYLFSASTTLAFNTDKSSTSTATSNLFNTNDKVLSAQIYNNRLYVLNITANNIIRYNNNGKVFSRGEPWTKDKGDLSGATDLSIDGNVYILFENGNILKYRAGIKADFNLSKIDPPIEKAKILHVSKDKDFIYVLEPKNSRIAVFNKKGEFILQYSISPLNNLKDFFVDEDQKIIYLLNNASLYKFPATHFDKTN